MSKIVAAENSTKRPFPQYKANRGYVEELVASVLEHAKPGVAYGVSVIHEHAREIGLPSVEGQQVKNLAMTMNELVLRHGWGRFSRWGYFGFDRKHGATLREAALFCAAFNVKTDAQVIANTIQTVYGIEVDMHSLRTTIQRLTNDGKFMRLESGVYQKVHRGF